MNKKFLALSLLIAGVAIMGISSTYAYQGDPNIKGPNYSSERHEVMIEAFENKNYQLWKETVGNRPIAEKISGEDFGKFVEARQLAKDGKIEKAKAIREELGLGLRQGKGNNMKRGEQGNFKEQRRGMGRNVEKGQNIGGRFIDANGDGQCDNFNQ